MEAEDYQIHWVEEIESHEEGVHEEVIAVENAQETHIPEGGGYIVQEITQIPNSLDQIAAENLIYMAHDGQMSSIDDLIEENVEENALEYDNDDQERQQQYFECQVTEEVITDDWVQQQGKECVEIPVDQICGLRSSTNQLVEDIDVPLPTDQDEYTALRPYPCDFCSRRFRKKVSLMNHMVAHQNDRPNVCNLCGARYVRKTDLLNHLKTHARIPEQIDEISEHYLGDHIESRSATERYFDDVSSLLEKPKQKARARNKKQRTKTGQKFSDYEKIEKPVIEDQIPQEIIEKYPVIDPRKPFVCQQCGVSFAREKALLSHHRLHGGDSPYECQQCNEMFWDINMLNDHQKTHHFEASNSEYEPENDEETESEDSKYGEYYCNVCGMSFHRQDLLKRHTKTHIKREIIQSDGICGESTRHCCNVCGETFAEALDLLAHAEIHARVQPYKCTLCGETFLEETTIKKHLMNVHSDEMTENSCKICGKHCKDLKSLTKHAWDHSRDKNHSCSKCGKNFHNKARLKRHMTSHRNKSVTCEVCNEEFPDGRSLMNHRHSHSNASGRQFPCQECGKTFGSRSSQQIHVRIHTGERPYGCRFCWKAFADGGTLRKHERIHTGEKPYACSVCPRAFNQRVVLREHIRAHHSGIDANRGVYMCSVCQSTLPSSSDLIQHLIHHSDLNTAMHRQPITGPRKYKRRRKLKPHEIMKLRHEKSNNSDDIDYSDLDIAHVDDLLGISNKNKRRSDYINTSSTTMTHQNTSARNRKYSSNSDKLTSNWQQKLMSPTSNDDTYNGVFQNLENTLNNIDSLVVSSTTNTTQTVPNINLTINQTTSPTTSNVNTPNKGNKTGSKRRGGNKDNTEKSSRPKMIHTQKTRVAAEEGSKRRTRTLITRTQPSDIDNNSFIQKRNTRRLKSKNSYDPNSNEYEMIIPDPEPCTAEQEQQQKQHTPTRTDLFDAQLLLETATMRKDSAKYTPDVINDLEEILRSPIKRKSKSPSTVREPSIFVIEKTTSPSSQSNQRSSQQQQQHKQKQQFHEEDLRRSTRLKRTSIPNKKYLEYDMSSTSKSTSKQSLTSSSMKNDQEKNDNRNSSALINKDIKIKVETITDDIVPSDKISIDDSKIKTESYFQCEMCCAVFTDRAQLLVHVPIHI